MRTSTSSGSALPAGPNVCLCITCSSLSCRSAGHFGDILQQKLPLSASSNFSSPFRATRPALSWPNSSRSSNIARQRGAIHLAEAKPRAHRELMNQARRRLLAAAALPHDAAPVHPPAPAIPPARAACASPGWKPQKRYLHRSARLVRWRFPVGALPGGLQVMADGASPALDRQPAAPGNRRPPDACASVFCEASSACASSRTWHIRDAPGATSAEYRGRRRRRAPGQAPPGRCDSPAAHVPALRIRCW